MQDFLDKYSPARKNLREENQELKEKLERAIKRNKRIIEDYSLCSQELQRLKNKNKGGRPSISKEVKEQVVILANAGKTQSVIAKELGISQKSVSNILRSAKLDYVLK